MRDICQIMREDGKNGWCGMCDHGANEIESLRAQLAKATAALEAAEGAYVALCGRAGYDAYQTLEDRATALRRTFLEGMRK